MFCQNCGKEISNDALFCPNCGHATKSAPENSKSEQDTLRTIAKIFMIIGTVINGLALIPLIWCIPMTLHYCQKLDNREPVSLAFKICSLLFVSQIGGILMLVDTAFTN